MRKIWITFLFSVIGLGLFLAIVQFSGWQNVLRVFLEMHWWQWLAVIGVNFTAMLIGAWRWKIALNEYDIKIAYKNLIGAYMGSAAVVYFLPVLGLFGEIAKAYTVTKPEDTTYEQIIPTILLDKIFIFFFNFCSISFAFIYFFIKQKMMLEVTYALIAFVLIYNLLVLSRKLGFLKKEIATPFEDTTNKYLKKFSEQWKMFFDSLENKKSAVLLFALGMLEFICYMIQAGLIIYFLTDAIMPFYRIVFVIGFSFLSLLTVVPAAVGSMELMQSLAFATLGFSGGAAVAYVLVQRLCELVLAIGGVIFYAGFGINKAVKILLQRKDD